MTEQSSLASAAVKVCLASVASDDSKRPWLRSNLRRLIRAADASTSKRYVRVESFEEADFILFVDSDDPFLRDVRSSRIYRQYKRKCFVYSVNDDAVPSVPGIYPDIALPLRSPQRHVGGFYLRCMDNEVLAAPPTYVEPEHLFSFVGNVGTCPRVRGRIVQIDHPRGLLRDRTSGMRDDDLDYVQTLRDSKFVVCPRGLGPTSWRFYEAMMAGRALVVVSDHWVQAPAIQWNRFVIRVPEADVASIPSRCEEHEERWREMGAEARSQWERHCSIRSAFEWVGDRLVEIDRNLGASSRTVDWFGELRDALRKRRLRRYLASLAKR